MTSIEKYAAKVLEDQVLALDEELNKIEKQLAKYQPLIEARDRLKAARRSILASRSTTANGGGRGTSQEEIVNFLRNNGEATVSAIAAGVQGTEGAVRAALNRQVDERYNVRSEGGVKLWSLRDPETEDTEDDDEDE